MQHPNIVFILADDMGYGDFGRFNNCVSATPTLDHLSEESLCFTQQYSASPVCNPSRAALLTGRYPHRTGSIDTLEWHGLERLALREITMADMLKQAGYTTGHVGKWHLGAFDPRYAPTQRGFDETVCFRGGMHDYYDWRIEYNNQPAHADGRYLTDVWTQEAVDFIDRHAKQGPFYLSLNFNAPHTPLQAPQDLVKPYLDAGFNKGVAHIYAMIERMDQGIAQVLEALERNGIRENTILIFTSDNGPQFGGEDEWSLERFNCNFNGCKGTTYEGGIRVPLLLRYPEAGFDTGTTFDRMTHFTDWFPTLLAMAGVQDQTILGDRTIDGVNLLPTLQGEANTICERRFWQWNRYTPLIECNAGMRDGEWKLVRPQIREAMDVPDIEWLKVSMYNYEYFLEHPVFTEDPPREVPAPPPAELYNLVDDPQESVNLAKQHPDIAARMLNDLENWFEEVDAERRTITDEW